MAQVWASYEEIAELCGCDAASAKQQCERLGWKRRICSDHVLRIKLPSDLAFDFMVATVGAGRVSARNARSQANTSIPLTSTPLRATTSRAA